MVLDTIVLGLRAIQLLFSIIVLGTGGAAINYLSKDHSDLYFYYFGYTPPQVAFILFCGAWTLLIVAFQIAAPRINETIGHKFVILALDALTMIFWFAGFIALAVLTSAIIAGSDTTSDLPGWYRSLQACTVFAAFTWITFVVTVVLNTLSVFRGNTHNKHGGGGASNNFQAQP